MTPGAMATKEIKAIVCFSITFPVRDGMVWIRTRKPARHDCKRTAACGASILSGDSERTCGAIGMAKFQMLNFCFTNR